ncbi:trimethylamine methyltransferase family protein [Desulfococcaceae bacterium HSG7]|nr:trimethylamine methyltransferase family protein [Desulfococcaceae bacterium HSG7]
MIKTNETIKAYPTFRMLTDDQITRIIKSALEILEKTGVKVLDEESRNIYKSAGARIDGEVVKLPEFIVRHSLETAPKGWVIYDRNGKRALEVECRKSYYGTSTASPNTKDALTGKYHETRVEDLEMAARMADAMEHIDWVMPMGSAQDVPDIAADLHEFVATVTNTIKPIVFLSYSARGMELIFKMAAEVAGGKEKLREKPFLVAYPEPISPLVLPGEVAQRILVAADWFLPQMMGPSVQMGATGPVTVPAAVAQGVAESMMCVVLAQLRNPGCPVGLGSNYSGFDMSRGLLTIAGPEMSLCQAAHAEVAQSLGLPTWGLAGATDAKVLDAQSGAEAMFSVFAQGLSGLNLIHDVGYMDMSMACAVEQLVLGNEIVGMVKHFMRGMDFSAEQMASGIWEEVGPAGHFLDHAHTLKHFKKELWRPEIFTRKPISTWKADGERDTETRIREKIQDLAENYTPEALPDSVIEKLEKIKTEGEKELAAK